MSESAQPERKAWQPITPSGIARFASASLNRLLVVQLTVGFLVAATVVWFLATCYAPVFLAAIQELPDSAEISKQQIHGVEPRLLAENRFLSIGIEPEQSAFTGVGDLQIRLGTSELQTCSLVGCLSWPYPAEWIVPLSRPTLEPGLGAWKPMILAAAGLLTVILLIILWWLLAFGYTCIPKLIAFYLDRHVDWKGSWKIACAAQLPGALFLAFAILLYGAGALDLVRFLIFCLLHLIIGWVFLILAPFFVPKNATNPPANNPFTGGKAEDIT